MVRGTMVIGSGDKTVPIPLTATLSPASPGAFVFDYMVDRPEEATHLDVSAFADWVANNFGQGVFDKSALPQSLQSLEVALKTVHLETTGNNLQVVVLLGSKGGDSEWKAEWKPVADLPLKLVDVALDIRQV
jgi:hypothetical protein